MADKESTEEKGPRPSEPREVRIFVSSPADVMAERQRLERVAERLNGRCASPARAGRMLRPLSTAQRAQYFLDAAPRIPRCGRVPLP